MNKEEKISYITDVIWETNHWNEYVWDMFIWVVYWDILDWLSENGQLELKDKISSYKYRLSLWEQDVITLDTLIDVINIVKTRNNIK